MKIARTTDEGNMVASRSDSGGGCRVGAQEEYFEDTHNLQFHCFPLQLNRPNLEVNADGAQVAVRERILREPQKKT